MDIGGAVEVSFLVESTFSPPTCVCSGGTFSTKMSHQHDHGHGHDHDHGHGDHDHGHDHSDETQPALQSLIWKQIEFDKIRCLNESETDGGRQVVEKQWSQRLEAEPVLESDADEQLLLFIPYVRLF